MHIIVEAVDVGSIETIIMIATDEDFVLIGQVAEPVHEVDRFFFGAHHAKVSGMNRHIGLGQLSKPMMAVMSIREMKYFHIIFVCKENINLSQFIIQHHNFYILCCIAKCVTVSVTLGFQKKHIIFFAVRIMVAQSLFNFASK